MKNKLPSTEEFLNYLKKNPDAKNKDIAEHFHIATTSAATLKSQIKKGTRPELKGFNNLAIKGLLKLTPDDPDWWNWDNLQPNPDSELYSKSGWNKTAGFYVNWFRDNYSNQSELVKGQIMALFYHYRTVNAPAPKTSLSEFAWIAKHIKGMCEEQIHESVDAHFRKQDTRVIVTQPKPAITKEEVMAMIDDINPKKQS